VLASTVVDRMLEPRTDQTKDNRIGIRCFSANHTVIRSKSKLCLAWNHDNVSECSYMSKCGLLFQ
jgi:hypothetical protein